MGERKESRPVRTDMNCTECHKNFIAQFDHGIDGDHVVECPYCGHEHLRKIRNGVITEERWGSRGQRINVDKRCVWKSDSAPLVTSIASAFIRESWLNKLDVHRE